MDGSESNFEYDSLHRLFFFSENNFFLLIFTPFCLSPFLQMRYDTKGGVGELFPSTQVTL